MNAAKGWIFRYRILWHVLFWVFWYLFFTITYGGYNDNYRIEFVINLYILPVRIAGTYVFIYYLLPFFLFKKKYFQFSVLALLHALLLGLGIWLVMYSFCYCPDCIVHIEYPLFYWPKIFSQIISNYQIPAIAAAIVIFKRWFLEQQQTKHLEKEKLESELKFLKAQIHPHFLFNTLNNLYSLTLKKSDKAPDIVLKLSDLLDYMLYNCNDTEVKLEAEINQLRGYIELEKIRYGKRLSVNFDVQGDPSGKVIAPLILIPFLENSFKHGASRETKSSFVDVKIDIQDACLFFSISNSFNNEELKNESYAEGIGLKNVQRRLELIYPNKHKLKIERKEGVFSVYLNVIWSENNSDCIGRL